MFLIAALLGASGSAEPVEFSDATASAGITFRHVNGGTGERHFIETMGPGCAFLDYDGDARPDIYLLNGHALGGPAADTETNALYRNTGDGRFVDVTATSGTGDRGYGVGVTAGDYDNDGDLDLYLANYGPNVLYRNEGDGRFTDVTGTLSVGDSLWGVGCAFLDYDLDGRLDLYVANYVDFSLEGSDRVLAPYIPGGMTDDRTVDYITAYPHPDNFSGSPDVLYRNAGAAGFTDVTRLAGVYNPGGKGMGMTCADYDNDGDTDVYVGNDMTPNFLYRNNGDGTFTDVALAAGVAYNGDGKMESSMGVDFGDFDGDGYLDLVVPNFQGEASTLYRNSGRGYFTDESFVAGIGLPTRAYVGWGTGFLDFDNDGDLDLFIAAGHVLDNAELFFADISYRQRNFLFRNDGAGESGRTTFSDVAAASGPGMAVVKSSRGTAFADYDGDGDLDILVINCNDTPTLLRNEGGNSQRWIQVRTAGVTSNRDGLGARLEVTVGGVTQVREVKSGSSLYSQSDLPVHVGLGASPEASVVRIRWPSGALDTHEGVAAGVRYVATEGAPLSVQIPDPR